VPGRGGSVQQSRPKNFSSWNFLNKYLYQQTAQGLFNNPDQRISGTIVYLAKEGLYNNPDPKNFASSSIF
jgi:hypothetical protein